MRIIHHWESSACCWPNYAFIAQRSVGRPWRQNGEALHHYIASFMVVPLSSTPGVEWRVRPRLRAGLSPSGFCLASFLPPSYPASSSLPLPLRLLQPHHGAAWHAGLRRGTSARFIAATVVALSLPALLHHPHELPPAPLGPPAMATSPCHSPTCSSRWSGST